MPPWKSRHMFKPSGRNYAESGQSGQDDSDFFIFLIKQGQLSSAMEWLG